MEELLKYTDEELRNELKRRASERKKNTKYVIEYGEFETTITNIDNIQCHYYNSVKYKPIALWRYTIDNCVVEGIDMKYHTSGYYVKQGCFKKDTMPKVGDKVILRYRKTKNKKYRIFDIKKSKIIKICNMS